MKIRNLILMLVLSCVSTGIFAQSVAVNATGSTADPSSMLDVQSTSKGMLIPRMTTAQRNAIPNPALGLLAFDTDTDQFWYFDGNAWKQIVASQSFANLLEDADSDTKIQVEESPDEDVVRVDIAGLERVLIDSSKWFLDGIDFLAQGDFDPSMKSALADSGAGTRMMWIPQLSAIRAGTVDSNEWNLSQVGAYSTVFGQASKATDLNTTVLGGRFNHAAAVGATIIGSDKGFANGMYSLLAGGTRDTVTGDYSAVIGGIQGNVTAELSGIVAGELNSISGTESFIGGGDFNRIHETEGFIGGGFGNEITGGGAFIAGGVENVASGWRGFTTGVGNTNPSYGEVVMGTYSSNYTPTSATLFTISDRLFTVGNGTSATNRSNALTILKSGNACLSCSDPGDSKLKIKQTVTGGGNVGGLKLENATGAGWEFFVFANGNLSLYYNGNIRGTYSNSSGVYSATSDRRLKKNIKPLESILEKVLKLNPSSYIYRDDKFMTPQIGMIAQEVAPLFPELVSEPDTENASVYTLDYSGFGILAIKAIQEQQQLIQALEARIEALEKK